MWKAFIVHNVVGTSLCCIYAIKSFAVLTISFYGCSLSESGRRESGSTITRRPSKARAFVNKFFRSSMRVITSPSVASPSEIQERFLYIINEAVVLATLFSKSTTVCESNLFGRVLQQLSSAGHGGTDAKPVALSHDADMVFSCGLLSYLLETVHICLVSVIQNEFFSLCYFILSCPSSVLALKMKHNFAFINMTEC